MRAVSVPLYHRVVPSPLSVAAAVICLFVSLALLAGGVILADVLGRLPEPLLMAPFRWEVSTAVA